MENIIEEKRGGKRPKAGRKKNIVKKKKITIVMDPELANLLKLKSRKKISAYIVNLIKIDLKIKT